MSKEYDGERFLPDECKGEIAIEHYQRYQFAKKLVEGKIVLDAACGEGYGSNLLAQDACRVMGVDIDEKVVEQANLKYGNNKLCFKTASIEKLPFEDNFFDVVVSYETIEHVNEEIQKKFLDEIRRVIKPNGIVIISTPNKAVYTDLVKGENRFHIKEFYTKEYLNFLKGYFENVEIFCQYPELGYFISREEEINEYTKNGKNSEESRYIIAICSDKEQNYSINTDDLTIFETSMYYYLNRYSHEKEQQVLEMKLEAEEFEKQQEMNICKQKEYIVQLEKDISEQKRYVTHLENDIKSLKNEYEKMMTELHKEIEQRERKILDYRKEAEKQEEEIENLNKIIENNFWMRLCKKVDNKIKRK